jgi:hypothetical protein
MMELEKAATCARHPNIETNLRCASCGTPICPKCMVTTPVGMKCRQCGSGANAALYQPSALQMLLAGLVGLAAGAVAGWGVEFSIGYWTIFLALIYGGFVGQMILRACGRKRGLRIEAPAVSGMIAGAFGGRVIVAALLLSHHQGAKPPIGVWEVLRDLIYPWPFPLIALIVVIVSALGRIRSRW